MSRFLVLPLWAAQLLLCNSRPALPRESDSAVALEVTHAAEPTTLIRRGGFLQGRCDGQDRPADVLFSAGNSKPHDYYLFDVDVATDNAPWKISELKLYSKNRLIPSGSISAQLVDTRSSRTSTVCGCMEDCSQNASSAFDGLLQTDACGSNKSIKLNVSFKEPTAVTMYTVVSSGSSGSADPLGWSLWGSHDGQLELLDRQEGIKFAAASWMCAPPFFATTTTSTSIHSSLTSLNTYGKHASSKATDTKAGVMSSKSTGVKRRDANSVEAVDKTLESVSLKADKSRRHRNYGKQVSSKAAFTRGTKVKAARSSKSTFTKVGNAKAAKAVAKAVRHLRKHKARGKAASSKATDTKGGGMKADKVRRHKIHGEQTSSKAADTKG